MGHVYNAKYQEFFDLARIAYFEEVLGDLISWKEKGLIIASVKTDYIQSTFLNDKIHVVSQVSSLGEKSLVMTQYVYKENVPEPITTGKTVMVCFDMQKRISEVIPDSWREKFIAFEPELNLG